MGVSDSQLIMQRGPTPGHIFALSGMAMKIGRATNNDIVINDPEMSRQHAQLIPQGDGYAVQDLGSTNGTFVNGQRIANMTPIYQGDVVAFGDAIFLLYQVDWETDSQPIPPPTIGKPQPVTAVSLEPEPVSIPASQPAAPPPAPPLSSPGPAIASSPQIPHLTVEDYVADAMAKRRRTWIVGCLAAFLIIICLCGALVFFLDAYEQGRYLYCGVLRPFWQLILGPFGFNPAC